ncbi:Uncharacterised protein [Mycobacteroides abscessus]|nr:Uncharacterised protein [Mycobacteroides abscessus]
MSSAIRCRGVVVTVRDGQPGSQYPHSTQRSTSAASSPPADDSTLRFRRCSWSSSVSTTPGLSRPCGSSSRLTSRMTA